MPLIRARFAVALVLLFMAGCATTHQAPPREPPASPTFFWKVTSQDKPGTVYVLGTMHMRNADNATLDAAVLEAVDGADRLVLELVPDEAEQQAIGALTRELGFFPEGESLFALLDDETRSRLEAKGEELGLPAAALDRMRPWLAALALSVQRMNNDGYTSGAGVEQSLLGRVSHLEEKPTESLETSEEQLRLFASLEPETQLMFLRDSLDEVEAGSAQVEGLQRAYQAGDAEALQALVFAQRGKSDDGDALYRAIFDERNERMVERMLRYFDVDEQTVVAVGAGHVLGERGIPALLLAKGFRVEAVPALGPVPVRPEGAPPPGAFEDRASGFAAEFHVAPDVQRGQFQGHDGQPAERMRALASAGLVELSVEVHGLPSALGEEPGFDARLEGIVKRLGTTLGTLESSEHISLQGSPGVRFDVRTAAHRVEGLVVFRGARMYTVIASRGSDGDPVADEERAAIMRRFLESFRLLEDES